MKNLLLLLSFFFFAGLNAQEDGKYKVYKTDGSTIICDRVSPGKTITCKVKGSDKIKLSCKDVKYYTIDDTTKYIVDADGVRYEVICENDSVYLTDLIKDVNGVEFYDYYLFRKDGNAEIKKIKKTHEALEDFKKYFGGCPDVDKKIAAYDKDFRKATFPYRDWDDIIYWYRFYCK